MKKYNLLLKPSNGAICLISAHNKEYYDYFSPDNFSEILFQGNHQECFEKLQEYWAENNISEEERTFLNIK